MENRNEVKYPLVPSIDGAALLVPNIEQNGKGCSESDRFESSLDKHYWPETPTIIY